MAGRRPAVQARRTARTGPELIEQWMHRIGAAMDRQVATLRSRMRAASTPARSRLAIRKPRSRPVVRGGRKTRAELYEMARKRGLPGRSRMRRDELARKLRRR